MSDNWVMLALVGVVGYMVFEHFATGGSGGVNDANVNGVAPTPTTTTNQQTTVQAYPYHVAPPNIHLPILNPGGGNHVIVGKIPGTRNSFA